MQSTGCMSSLQHEDVMINVLGCDRLTGDPATSDMGVCTASHYVMVYVCAGPASLTACGDPAAQILPPIVRERTRSNEICIKLYVPSVEQCVPRLAECCGDRSFAACLAFLDASQNPVCGRPAGRRSLRSALSTPPPRCHVDLRGRSCRNPSTQSSPVTRV